MDMVQFFLLLVFCTRGRGKGDRLWANMSKICGRWESKSTGGDKTGGEAAMKNYHVKAQTVLSLAGIQATQTAQRSSSAPPEITDLVNRLIGNPAWSGNSLYICWEAWQTRDKVFLPWSWKKAMFLFLQQKDLWDTLEDTSYDINESLFLFKNQISPLSSRKPKVAVTTRVTKRRSFFLLLSSHGLCLSITHLFVLLHLNSCQKENQK